MWCPSRGRYDVFMGQERTRATWDTDGPPCDEQEQVSNAPPCSPLRLRPRPAALPRTTERVSPRLLRIARLRPGSPTKETLCPLARWLHRQRRLSPVVKTPGRSCFG